MRCPLDFRTCSCIEDNKTHCQRHQELEPEDGYRDNRGDLQDFTLRMEPMLAEERVAQS